MSKIVYILRGLAGAGKSTQVQILAYYLTVCERKEFVICSADQFFTRGGQYFFEAEKLGMAHEYCRDKFIQVLEDKFECVIVDNTNTLHKEYKFYKDEAIKAGYQVQVITVGEFTEEAIDKYALRNTHGVPRDKIKQMRDRFQL